MGIDEDGRVYSWGTSNAQKKLCRSGPAKGPQPVEFAAAAGSSPAPPPPAKRVYAGGTNESGHAAILDHNNQLWMCGCDRWQQLGFGNPLAGATGYTWTKIWHDKFQTNIHVQGKIRDVALGEDHTVVLTDNGDVWTHGKGSEGQLGLSTKPFVHASSKSSTLSRPDAAAVCAIRHCSVTLNEQGEVLATAGKCKHIQEGLEACRKRGFDMGLLCQKEG